MMMSLIAMRRAVGVAERAGAPDAAPVVVADETSLVEEDFAV
jgi:hypothetical protein